MPSTQQLEQQYKVSDSLMSPTGGGGSNPSDGFVLPPITGHQVQHHQYATAGGQSGNYANGGFGHQPAFNGNQLEVFASPTNSHAQVANGGNAGYRMLGEFEYEIQRLREENSQLRYQKELRERDFENAMSENYSLQGKLENLENVFIGSAIQRDGLSSSHSNKLTQDYTTSTLLLDNTELKKRVGRLEEEKMELKQALHMSQAAGAAALGGGGAAVVVAPIDSGEVYQLRQSNMELQKRVEFLQKRERELMDALVKSSGGPKAQGGGR